MKRFILIVVIFSGVYAGIPDVAVNINTATYEELKNLNLTESQIFDIQDYLDRNGYFSTIYDLLSIPSITAGDLERLKPGIIVLHPEYSRYIQARQRASYKLGQWMNAEGNSEGLSEIWLDRFFEPMNINYMNYDDLMSLPNLSPVDAAAVLKQQKRGEIKGTFELRNAPGISYWGYRNLRDFVEFSTEDKKPQLHFRMTQLVRNIPVTTNLDDEGDVFTFQNDSRPEIFQRYTMNYGNHIKTGYVFYRNMGNPTRVKTDKKYISFENMKMGNLHLDRLVLGNFTAAFGQGVVMETSDYFSPRRTGYGFSKRTDGIFPDMTRSTQYVMDGIGLQLSNSFVRVAMFGSYEPRDAILNKPQVIADTTVTSPGQYDITYHTEQSFSTLLLMQPRLPWGFNGTAPPVSPGEEASFEDSLLYAEALELWQDTTKIYGSLIHSVNEMTWGWNIRLTPVIGTNIGMTFYESLYDRILDPQVINSITGGPDDTDAGFDALTDYDQYSGDAFYLRYMTNSADPEIAAMYRSSGTSPLWDDARSYRRVIGFDFSSVIGNVVFQGEYGEFLSDSKFFNLGDEPSALVFSTYAQFNNFNFLALYRDYDLEFDNPYQRSFSNYQRYKTTIFEDYYWLDDPIYSYLYSGSTQPQAETGVYLSGRYQFHRSFVGTLNWDTWVRGADDARYYRTVATIDWRPNFNYRVNIRQKWQARGYMDIAHPSPFNSRETRIRVRLRLSGFDQVELLYSLGHTTFSPRPRLTDNGIVPGADVMVGDVGSPDRTIGVSMVHNFDPHLTLRGGSLFIRGFLWNFEDTDFMVYNMEGGGIRNWISFTFKPTLNLSVKLKLTHTPEKTFTRVTEGQSGSGAWISNPVLNNNNTDYRIQIDYAF